METLAEPADQPVRVLVAEDVEAIAELMTRSLERLRLEIAIASDGAQCLEMVRSFRPDLILLDIMMPKLHGIEVLKRLKADEETQHIPVIVTTAKTFRTDRNRARELGAAGFVFKPFVPEELRSKVLEVLEAGSSGTGTQDSQGGAGTQALPMIPASTYDPAIDASRGCLHFWGTRGSIPVSGQASARHGGNTTCLSFEYGDELLIFDAGSGIRDLGLVLADRAPRKLHLFITHTHWDHIQGFPFFAPAFIPGFEIVVYGARGLHKDLESLLRGQLDPDYFPIQMVNMDASLDFVYLDDGPLQIGDVQVSWELVQHPGVTLGYRIEAGGRSVAFVPDNEIFQGHMGAPETIARATQLLDTYRPIIDFLTDVDLLIHEAQYTPKEYRQTARYGHSSFPNACFLAKITNAGRWVVVHHDPNHTDDFLQDKLNLTRQVLAGLDHPIEVVHGHDGRVEYL